MVRAVARVDLAAVGANLRRLAEAAPTADLMPVVKADGYGHGMLPVAEVARAAGAAWLGVALPSEAMALRRAGDTGRVLAWLWCPGDPEVRDCVAADVDLSAGAEWAVDELAAAARGTGRPARVHLKVDTGLGRGGSPRDRWEALLEHAAAAASDGSIEVVGIWSHLSCADEPGHPATDAQLAAFADALTVAQRRGIRPLVRHLASSGAVLSDPRTHFDLVRPGIAVYGISPGDGLGSAARLGLRPAMTLSAEVALAKRLPAGHGVSYSLTWHAPTETGVALVPVGYGDGIPRTSDGAEVLLAGRRRPVRGRIAMDQFVVDVGDDPVAAGDPVTVFGPGDAGEPTAADWASAASTIAYEIVTRIGPRVPREYVGGTP